jgi:hypothetical protein
MGTEEEREKERKTVLRGPIDGLREHERGKKNQN